MIRSSSQGQLLISFLLKLLLMFHTVFHQLFRLIQKAQVMICPCFPPGKLPPPLAVLGKIGVIGIPLLSKKLFPILLQIAAYLIHL